MNVNLHNKPALPIILLPYPRLSSCKFPGREKGQRRWEKNSELELKILKLILRLRMSLNYLTSLQLAIIYGGLGISLLRCSN